MKIKILIIFTMLVIIASAYNVSAAGMSGTHMKIFTDFEPGEQLTYTYNINPSSKTNNYTYTVRGPEYLLEAVSISFNPPYIGIINAGEKITFDATIGMSGELGPPGLHKMFFGVAETPDSAGSGVSVRTGIEVPVTILVLYPEKYAQTHLEVADVSEGEPISFEVTVENWGEVNISSASATIYLYGPDNETLATFQTEDRPVESAGYSVLTAALNDPGLDPGEYSAKASVSWDGNISEAYTQFRVGTPELKILGYNDTIKSGEINLVVIELENEWNMPMSGVYASIRMDDMAKTEIVTSPIELGPFEKGTLETYFNAESLVVGEYNARMTIHFNGGSKVQDITISVVGEDGGAPSPVSQTDSQTLMLVAIVALAAVIVAGLYIKTRKPTRRRR
jgi:hypothetical protein